MKILTKEQLVKMLKAIVAEVEVDDSYEGSFQYTLSDEPGKFEVNASIRVGNSQGQGGVTIL